jgi:hypothetical protein
MSNKTGKYIYDLEQKKVVKVSETPFVTSANGRHAVWFPSSGKYFDTMAQRTFHTKEEKKAWMQDKGVIEVGAGSNPLKGLAESRDCRQRKHFNV